MTTSVPLARRQFLSQSTSLTLSAAAIGALAGVPRLARDRWSLTIDGLVEHPRTPGFHIPSNLVVVR